VPPVACLSSPVAPSRASAAAPRIERGGLYRNVWRHAEGARAVLLGSMALLVVSQLAKLAVPWAAAQAINELQTGGSAPLGAAALWVLGVLGLFVLSWAMHGPGRVLERNVGVRVRERLSAELYAKLGRAPLGWHEQHHAADLQQRMLQASDALYGFAQNQFIYLQSAVNFVGPLLALMLLSSLTGTLALVGYVLVALVIVRFDRVLMVLAARENDANRRYGARALDFITSMPTVLALRLQQSARRLIGQRLEAVFEPLKRAIVLTEAKWCAVDLLSVGLTWGLVLAYAWHAGHQGGALLIGSVFMVYEYAQRAGGVIGSIAANFQGYARTRVDFASADLIWQAPEVAQAAPAVDADWQRIEIRDLSFTREGAASDASATADDRGGVHHVHLALQRGERIALVGASGSGKSTLMRLLAGLYAAQRGHFEIDGVARFGVRHLGSVATLIVQEADVFEGTVRENILLGEKGDERTLEMALQCSQFETILESLPQGLETSIADRGANLSGGQRQRLCLARGLVAAADSSLLLLDEPTSALDPLTEARVFEQLDAAFPDACIVASVHRMSLLGHFDKIVLMAAGRVVDVGTQAELASRQPGFRQLLAGRPQASAHGGMPEAAAVAAA
jgi:ABC-type multidrug transport system fused ATPase/permease subunit